MWGQPPSAVQSSKARWSFYAQLMRVPPSLSVFVVPGPTLRGAELVEILSVEKLSIVETFAAGLQSIAIAHRQHSTNFHLLENPKLNLRRNYAVH
jgi:hypothetical protein